MRSRAASAFAWQVSRGNSSLCGGQERGAPLSGHVRQRHVCLAKRRRTSHRVILDHVEAMDCRDCEDYLRLGLQAFNWLRTACEHIKEDVCSGQAMYSEELEQSITELYAGWLEPSAEAEEWIAEQEKRGYTVDVAAEFRRRAPRPGIFRATVTRSCGALRCAFIPGRSARKTGFDSDSCSRNTPTSIGCLCPTNTIHGQDHPGGSLRHSRSGFGCRT